MGTRYRQINEQDRIFLRIMLEKRYSTAKIAQTLGFNRRTIQREIKRNSCTHNYSGKKFYWSMRAQQKAMARRKRPTKLCIDEKLKQYVHLKLKQGWSPWQIEGRLKLENEGKCVISHETIYRYIYSSYAIRNLFFHHLRRKHFHRIKHGARKRRIPENMLYRLDLTRSIVAIYLVIGKGI